MIIMKQLNKIMSIDRKTIHFHFSLLPFEKGPFFQMAMEDFKK